jgi:phosphonate transport system substrate-binding protein
MEAVDRAGAEIFAQQVDLYGRPGYWSLLIVHKDSPIKTIDDVIKNPGKWTFGNGDPNSTSGFLVPSVFFFQKYGIDAKTHFKRVVNASHEVNALAVANKQVDIATNNTENLYDPDNPSQKVGRLFKSNPEKAEQIRVIWKSPLIPSDPIAYRKDLPAELKYAIQGFFLSYGRLGPDAERERKVLAGVSAGLAPYRPSSNDQLIPVLEMELSKAREKLSSDASLAPAEKAAKTAAIDKALEALRQRAAILAN